MMAPGRGLRGSLLLVALGGTVVAAAPRLVVEAPIHDFGVVEQGTPVEHLFVVRNAGEDPLRIESVRGTCACTVATGGGTTVPPGDFVHVAVRLDTARLSGRTVKTVTLVTDDAALPTHPLTLMGTVRTDLTLTPPALFLGRVRRGETVRREVQLLPGAGAGEFTAERVETDTPAVRARLATREGGAQALEVELDGSVAAGRFDDVVRIRTTSPRQPLLELPVFGVVETDVAVLPPRVTFGIGRDGIEPADVHIRNRGRRPMAVTRVTVPEPVDYQLTTVRSGMEYRLTLRLREPPPDPASFEACVEVLTDHPAERRIVVPVYAIDRRRG